LTGKSSAPEGGGAVAYTSEPESRLRALWRDVLGADEAPERVSFFSAGGDSVKAVKLIARVNREFGIRLELREIFSHSSFEEFAAQVSAQRRETQMDHPGNPVAELGQLRPSPMQERRLRHTLRAAKEGQLLSNWLCGLVCELEAAVTDEVIEGAINALVARHDALRAGFRFTPDGEIGELFVLPTATVELNRVLLSDGSPSVRSQLILQHAAETLDAHLPLSEPPLMCARLCRFSKDHAVLIMAIEHLVCDGTSLDLIFDDLAAALSGTLAESRPALQYSEWVRRQHSQLTGPRRDDLLAFWRGALKGTLPYPDLGLPVPPPGSQVQGRSESMPGPAQSDLRRNIPGHGASGPLPADLAEDQVLRFMAADLNLARTTLGPLGITIFMAMMSCIARAWQIVTDHNEIVIHTPVDNRSMSDADTVVGWLAHAVVLRIPLNREQLSWADRLSAVRDHVLDALAHQELPLSEVIKDLQPEVYNPGPRKARLFYRYNNARRRRLPITGGVMSDWAPAEDFVRADAGISFLATEDHDGCTVRLVYDTGGVDASFVKALRSHIDEAWQDLLSAVAAPRPADQK